MSVEGERNLFSAFAEGNRKFRRRDYDKKRFMTRETRNQHKNGVSDRQESLNTRASGRQQNDHMNKEEVDTGLRRSNRANKGVQREIFDPSHIPSPSRKINIIPQAKSEDAKNSDDGSDSGKKPKGKPKQRRLRKNEKDKASDGSEESGSDSDETDTSYSDPKKLWCICKKPHGGRFMISCDVCEEWFHGDCVGISVNRGKQMEKRGEEYVCPACVKNKEKKLKQTNSVKRDTKPKSGVKLKGYAHNEAQNIEKRKSKDLEPTKEKPKATEGEPSVKKRKCIVSTCLNKAQLDSVYCSNVCILRHAKESLVGVGEKCVKQETAPKPPPVQRQESKEERILRKIREASSKGKVAVMCLKTGKIFANASAPLKEELETFLKQNPTFQKLKLSKSLREKLQQKEQQPQKVKRENSQNQKVSTDQVKKLKQQKEHETQKKELIKLPSDPDYKPQEKNFSNPYKKFTPISPRDEKAAVKAKKHKMQRQDSGESKKPKHRHDSERRHSLDKNVPSKITPSKRDSRSTSEDKSSSKKDGSSHGDREVRSNIQKSLQGILQNRSNNSEDLKMHPDSINRLVSKVEESLYKLFGGVNSKYKNRYRSIMFNLKDEKNEGLWRKVILGEVPSSRLVKMTPEEMASKELAQWRKHELTQELEMIQELEVANQTIRPVAKITHKGEIAINEDYSDLTESHLENSTEKSTPTIAPQRIRRISLTQPDNIDESTPQTTDTTSEHNNHLFDLNCMICTGQVKEEDASLEDSGVKATKRSTSIILSHEAQTPIEKESDEDIMKKITEFSQRKEKPVGDLDKVEKSVIDEVEESLPDNADDDDVPNNSTDLNKEKILPLKRKPSWEDFVWAGTISMPELSSFRSNAYNVSGNGQELVTIIPSKLVLDGRIHPRVVWEYLSKVRTFSNKEVCVVQFRPSSEEDRNGFAAMLSYFSSRKRFGVVSNQNTQIIKDIYLAPLLEGEEVPRHLKPLRGPGIDSDHPSMLLGIVVRCVPEVKRSFRDIESRIAKITGTQKQHRISEISLSPTEISPKEILPSLPTKILEESPKNNLEEEEEYNPETADFGDILHEDQSTEQEEDDEEAYDPEKLVFDDEEGKNDSKEDEDDDTPYDPEDEAERLESTEVKALQEKQALLEKMKQELEQKQAELVKEEMSLQQTSAPPPPPPVLKPTKIVSQTQTDPRMAARLNKNKTTTAEPENPLQKIFSVLNIERPGSM